jgi:Reverse transcriptase (RNA-dependent DNA polymerase)
MKESNPVEVAEYATAMGIDHEPAFVWWVNWTLKRRDRIIAAVNNRTLKRTHKFGIAIPRNVDEAHKLDRENGNDYWAQAIKKEMTNVRVAFDILAEGRVVPVGYQFIKCHGIFDVKMDSFQRKYRMVAGGHMTETPASMTYASVVSRESVRIALMLAALNDLQVKTADIENAYLTAPVSEKIWTTLGPEFGNDQGSKAIIVRALYGLKSAGASFRNHLAACMRQLGYTSCLADPDVWLRAETRPDDGFKYYLYMLLYIDDILAINHDAMSLINEVDRFFKMKAGSVGDPDIYLGAKLREVQLPNGVNAWSLSASKYVQEAVRNVKDYFKRERPSHIWPKRAPTPFPRDYKPELDISPELGDDEASFFQSQIGVLRWMVEIGRIDIITEVSMLASCVAAPRQGHLEVVFHMYAYLERKHNSRLVFDPTYPDIDMSEFKECDWRDYYGDVQEAIPANAPTPRGKDVDIRLYVDSDHAGDRATRRSRTGFLVYINAALITWYSKRQPTVESSVFGAEFVALKNGMESVRGLWYKLRMMGVPIGGPTYTYGDNMSVIHNTQRPDSTLKKKSNSICYHACREAVAMGEMLTTHIPTALNPADLATKIIAGGIKRNSLLEMVMYDIT